MVEDLLSYPYIPTFNKLLKSNQLIMTGPNLEFDGLAIPWVPAVKPEDETNMHPYRKQTRKTITLHVGWKFQEGRRVLHEELIFDEHVEIPLRDGVKVGQLTITQKTVLIWWTRSTPTSLGQSQTRSSQPY